MIKYFVILAIVGYICGLLQSGYLVGKLQGLDIRNYGSGNAGTTNVLRVLGKSRALATFLGDGLKGHLPVVFLKYYIGPNIPGFPVELAALFIGLFVVFGHNYPFYLKFKGGKGVATTAAVFTAFDWKFCVCSMLIFGITVGITRYVSLSSILMAIGLAVEMLIFYPGRWDLFIITCVFTFFIVWRHRANIKRLLNGTESKLGQKVQVKS